MNRGIAIVVAAALALPPAFAQNQVQVVNTAEIEKIDAKKMTLKVKSDPTQPDTAIPVSRPAGGGGRRGGVNVGGAGGVGVPGGGRRGGGGYPGGGAGGGSTNKPQPREYKVTLTTDTVLKDGDSTISLSSLKTGDHIIITGNPKGNDVEATSITRDKH